MSLVINTPGNQNNICKCSFVKMRVVKPTTPHGSNTALVYKINAPLCTEEVKTHLSKKVVSRDYYDLQIENDFGDWIKVASNVIPFCDSCHIFTKEDEVFCGCDHQQYCLSCHNHLSPP
jgi:hypothetical protein